MDFKPFLKTFFLAFIIFSVVVALGMKYNWVRYLQSDSEQDSSRHSGKLPHAEKQSFPIVKEEPLPKVDNYELVDEDNSIASNEQQIRNDCIRASRQAGVTDEHIFAVVDQCVAMSLEEQNTPGYPANTDPNSTAVVNEKDGLELTRKACIIVADEEQTKTEEERRQIVEQCIKANMDN